MGNRALDGADVIQNFLDPRLAGGQGINNQFKAGRRQAFVARRVFFDDDNGVLAFGQRCFGGEFPLAIAAHDGLTDHLVTVLDDDRIARCAGAAEGWGSVVGGTTVFDRPLHIAGVVFDFAELRRRGHHRVVMVVIAAITIAGPCRAAHRQRTQAQQRRPEPAHTGGGDQAIKDAQFFTARHLRRRNAVHEKGHFVILLGIGGDIGVVGAVFDHTHQLALGIKEAFDDQLGLVWVSAFQGNMQVFAYTLDGDFFRGNAFVTFGQHVLAVCNSFDAHRLALGVGPQLGGLGNGLTIDYGHIHYVCVHSIDSFDGWVEVSRACDVDVSSNVLP